MRLGELNWLPVPPGAAGIDVASVELDSRRVTPGALFAALPGSVADGMDYATQAVANGAVAILAGPDAPETVNGVPVIRADDPRLALARVAKVMHPHQPRNIAAVTGTAGKTSVASFARQIWERRGLTAAMIGTTGVFAPGRADYGSLTTPDAVSLTRLVSQLASEGVEALALEASSHGLDQRRLHGLDVTMGAFTNLGHDHLDYHPTMEAYLDAKLRLFRELLDPGRHIAVVNADDEWSPAVLAALDERQHVVSVGRRGETLRVKRVEQEQFRQVADVEWRGTPHRVAVPLAGEFQLSNALVAAVIGGFDLRDTWTDDMAAAFEALEHLVGASGRLDLVGKSAAGAPVYVDYAHKPDALQHVLSALRPYTTGRLVVVFGCGGDRDRGKRPIMGAIATRLADRVIVTDDNPRSEEAAAIRAAILAEAPGADEIADRRTAIETAVGELARGDTLVIAGKGHEEGQIVGETTHPFSDHAVAREALDRHAAGAAG